MPIDISTLPPFVQAFAHEFPDLINGTSSDALHGMPDKASAKSDAETVERARTYLARMEPAISGQGGHSRLFAAARAMAYGFALAPETALQLLETEYNPRCSPPWNTRELSHKISEAIAKPSKHPYGHLATAEHERSGFPELSPEDAALADALFSPPQAPSLASSPLASPASRNSATAKLDSESESITQSHPLRVPQSEGIERQPDDSERLALIFLQKYIRKNRRCLIYNKSEFLAWTGRNWERIERDEIESLAWDSIQKTFKQDWKRKQERDADNPKPEGEEGKASAAMPVTNSICKNTVSAIKAKCLHVKELPSPSWLAKPANMPEARELVPVANGLVNVAKWIEGTDCVEPHTPDYFNCNVTDYPVNRNAPEPTEWIKFLGSVWEDDTESITLLQQWMGYLLTADTTQQKILLMLGPPRSGKGTIHRVIHSLVGKSNCGSPTLGSLGTEFGLEGLVDKTVALVSDARLSHATDVGILKERLLSISGGDSISVNRKYKPHLHGVLPLRIVIATNEIPNLTDASSALAGRFSILRFTRTFAGQEDKGLSDRLLAELPGIFSWAMRGLHSLRQSGRFTLPEASRELIAEVEATSSPIHTFLQECCIKGSEFSVLTDDLFAEWKKWCESEGRKEPGTRERFGRELRAAVPELKRVQARVGKTYSRNYLGIRLATEDERQTEIVTGSWSVTGSVTGSDSITGHNASFGDDMI